MEPQFVVGMDFTFLSQAALRLATSFARQHGGSLHLVHAIHYPGRFSGEERRDLYEARVGEESSQRMTAITDKLLAEGLRVQWRVENGDPAKIIPAYAAEHNADMVFLGTHGDRPSDVPFLGTVTLAILRKCERPVMVVHSSLDWTPGPLRALAPISRSYGVKGIVDFMQGLHFPMPLTIDLLHIYDGPSEQAERFMQRKSQEMRDAGINIGHGSIIPGEDITEAIFSYMKDAEQPYDLLLLESRHRTEYGALTLGGAMEEIIVSSKRPVLCVTGNQEDEIEE